MSFKPVLCVGQGVGTIGLAASATRLAPRISHRRLVVRLQQLPHVAWAGSSSTGFDRSPLFSKALRPSRALDFQALCQAVDRRFQETLFGDHWGLCGVHCGP